MFHNFLRPFEDYVAQLRASWCGWVQMAPPACAGRPAAGKHDSIVCPEVDRQRERRSAAHTALYPSRSPTVQNPRHHVLAQTIMCHPGACAEGA